MTQSRLVASHDILLYLLLHILYNYICSSVLSLTPSQLLTQLLSFHMYHQKHFEPQSFVAYYVPKFVKIFFVICSVGSDANA